MYRSGWKGVRESERERKRRNVASAEPMTPGKRANNASFRSSKKEGRKREKGIEGKTEKSREREREREREDVPFCSRGRAIEFTAWLPSG